MRGPNRTLHARKLARRRLSAQLTSRSCMAFALHREHSASAGYKVCRARHFAGAHITTLSEPRRQYAESVIGLGR